MLKVTMLNCFKNYMSVLMKKILALRKKVIKRKKKHDHARKKRKPIFLKHA